MGDCQRRWRTASLIRIKKNGTTATGFVCTEVVWYMHGYVVAMVFYPNQYATCMTSGWIWLSCVRLYTSMTLSIAVLSW